MGKSILFISGTVELTEGKRKKKTHRQFRGVVVVGDNESEVRANFDYSRAFNDRQDQKKARELQRAGCVRLVNYQIEKHLGATVY